MAFMILRRSRLTATRPKSAADNALLFSSTSTTTTTPFPPADEPPIVADVVSLLTHHRFKSRWSHLRSLLSSDRTPLSSPHFSQISLQLKSNPHLALRFFDFTRRNSSLCSHDAHSFATVIHVLSRARLKSPAQSVIRAALLNRELCSEDDEAEAPPLKLFEVLVKTYRLCDSAPFVFDLLIKSCLELRKIDGALEIVRKLRSRGISPQINTCNALISWVSKCRGSYAGYEMFLELFGSAGSEEVEGKGKRSLRNGPNVESFNLLMEGFYRDGEVEMVEEMWLEMERFGCVGNEHSYSIMLAVYSEAGKKMTEAVKLWESMAEKGVKPEAMAYNTIIGGFCRAGDLKNGEEFFREMEMSGVECSSGISFEHLIGGYGRAGDVDSALLVYKDMLRKGFKPDAVTIEVLIGGLCEKKRVSEGLQVMRSAMKDVSFFPSQKSYEFLIRGSCEDGELEVAGKLQAEMVGKGFEPNAEVYGAFVEGYARVGNEEMVEKLRKEMSDRLEIADNETKS